jgi:hypothetical protein
MAMMVMIIGLHDHDHYNHHNFITSIDDYNDRYNMHIYLYVCVSILLTFIDIFHHHIDFFESHPYIYIYTLW